MKLERRHQPLASSRTFWNRQVRFVLGAMGIVGASLLIGTAGYMHFAGYRLVDAFLNASMILGGMGPVAELHTAGGKVFAGTYALFAGLVFVLAIGVVLAPVLHRAMHRFHLDGKA